MRKEEKKLPTKHVKGHGKGKEREKITDHDQAIGGLIEAMRELMSSGIHTPKTIGFTADIYENDKEIMKNMNYITNANKNCLANGPRTSDPGLRITDYGLRTPDLP